VTVNKTLDELLQLHDELQPDVFQLHGDESVEIAHALKVRNVRFWAACSGDTATAKNRALQMSDAGAEAVLLDARTQHDGVIVYGGTGLRSDWQLARELVEHGLRVVLAGGLSPENVREAIQTVQPWAVDVLSGVEAQKGVKDADRVLDFMRNAREA
jgi:phosphoribosylanthranilate isomerase